MNRRVELRKICHSRAGDKGDSVNLSLIPYDPDHYDLIRREITVERVREHFGDSVKGEIERYELPNISALNFVLNGALGGGSTRALGRDIHGKALSGVFLDMPIDIPVDLNLPFDGAPRGSK